MPTTVEHSGTSCRTTEPAPIFAPLPTVMDPSTLAPVEIRASSSIVGCLLPFLFLFPKRHALKNRDIVSDLTGFADHNPHAVINEKSPADLGTRVNFDSRKEAGDLRDRSGDEKPFLLYKACAIRCAHIACKPE